MSNRDSIMTETSLIPITSSSDATRAGPNPPSHSDAILQTATQSITVAAIIPLYNGAPFIREALNSVLAQTEPANEIIVVDDGSTDDGAGSAIANEMAKDHPIRLLTKKNGGQGSARNTGIAACSSSHIALLDQDDIWYEDHLAVLKQPFLKAGRPENLGLVYGNMDRIDKSGRMVWRNFLDELSSPHPKTSLFQCLSQDMYILPGASLFTKTAWEKVGGFDERLAGYEDDDLFIRMFSAHIESVFLKKPVFKWRIYSDSTSYSPRMARSRMIYFHKLIENYPDEPQLNLYWCRDAIGPRFLNIVANEFIDGSRLGDSPRMMKAWSDINEMFPVMPRRARRRLSVAAPLITALSHSPLRTVGRSLFRWAIRPVRRRR